MGAASGGRLTLLLVGLAVLMASGTTGIVVSGTGSAPPAGRGRASTQLVGSSDQRPDRGQQATAQAHPDSAVSAAAAASASARVAAAGTTTVGPADRYNVGAAHSPELLRDLAGPLAGPGGPSGTLPRGVDVAAAQHPDGAGIDWPEVAAAGYSFAAVKATEGDYYANPWYAADTAGAQAAGLQVTGYHVAVPNVSGGAAQASYAVRHLGQTADGRARPLELDVEYDPYTATDHTNQCYGLTPAELVSWIGAFTQEAQQLTGQAPVIYTSAAWWRACTGDSTAFSDGPLWVAGSGITGPSYPAAWASWSYWQFTSAGTVPGIAASGGTDVSYAAARNPVPFASGASAAGVAGVAGAAATRPAVTVPAASVPSAVARPGSPVVQGVTPAPAMSAAAAAASAPAPGVGG